MIWHTIVTKLITICKNITATLNRYRGSSPNAHNGTWEKPCYAKSRCVRLLLCNECSTETPKPRKIEESVLDEVTTV